MKACLPLVILAVLGHMEEALMDLMLEGTYVATGGVVMRALVVLVVLALVAPCMLGHMIDQTGWKYIS